MPEESSETPDAARRVRLFVTSFLLLFVELTLIRWIPGQVRVLAYFTNFVLIASFFGFGVGMLLAAARVDTVRWAGAGVLVLVLLCLYFRGVRISGPGFGGLS